MMPQYQQVVAHKPSSIARGLTTNIGDGYTRRVDKKIIFSAGNIELLEGFRRDYQPFGSEPGDEIGWVQSVFTNRWEGDYYTTAGAYKISYIQEHYSSTGIIDGDEDRSFWYGQPRVIGDKGSSHFGKPSPADIIACLLEDKPQDALPEYYEGAKLMRCFGEKKFVAHLIVRKANKTIIYLRHVAWTCSYFMECLNDDWTPHYNTTQITSQGVGRGKVAAAVEVGETRMGANMYYEQVKPPIWYFVQALAGHGFHQSNDREAFDRTLL